MTNIYGILGIFLLWTNLCFGSQISDGEDLDLRRELTELKDALKRLTREKDELYTRLNQTENESHLPPQQLPRRNLEKTAFTATLSGDLQVIDGEIVVFDTILVDNLGDYDPTFGFFSCTSPGTYMFILTVVAPRGFKSSARIIHMSGGVETVMDVLPETYDVGLAYTGPHTIQVLLSCQVGDLVFIHSHSPTGDPTVWYAGDSQTVFTGYYI